ncbi:MAG: DUF3999 family protein [Candidatus Edwardsbacteria bacterium]|jgi:hypothetical protein|nr:DUF3999 family protein [Candidatus Edwardsbacteria bacterium]
MRTWAAALLLCAGAVCHGAVDPGDFRYRKVPVPGDSVRSDVGVINFDSDLYRSTRDDLSDIRLAGPGRREIPYLIRMATRTDTATVRLSIALETIEFTEGPDNSITIILLREETDSIPDELDIGTPNKDFEKSVSVYGSNDRASWRALAVDRPIFDYSRYIDVRNTSIALQKRAFSYYKVVVGKAVAVRRSPFSQIVTEIGTRPGVRYESFLQNTEPFRIERAAFFEFRSTVRASNPLPVAYSLPVIAAVSDTARKTTTVYCRSDREPINEIRLSTASRFFRRQVVVEGTNDTSRSATWIPMTTSIVQRLAMGTYRRESLSIPLDDWRRYLRYRLIISHQDNPPIEVTGISALGGVHQLFFFCDQGESLTVYYGGEDIDPPRYDVAALLADIPRVEGAQWRLGAQVPAGGRSPGGRRRWINPKAVLIASLIVMVGVLAAVLFLTTKKVEQATEQNDER